MRRTISPIIAGAAVAAAVVVAGDVRAEAWVLAAIAGSIFADLVRRGLRERAPAMGDSTDLASGAAYLAILIGAAVDLGRGHEGVPSWTERALGTVLIALGVALRAWAVRVLGESFSVRLGIGDRHRLVDGGPYRWVRHPNYGALLVIALGTALGLASPLALAATVLVWLPVVLARVAREERLLLTHYGEAYEAYRRRSWALVPGIY